MHSAGGVSGDPIAPIVSGVPGSRLMEPAASRVLGAKG